MKKLFYLLMCFVISITILTAGSANADNEPSSGDFSKSAKEFVSQIKIGWNLGNTLDAYPQTSNPSIYEQETAWWNPYTTREMIDRVAQSGFNAVRIPVSWGPQVRTQGEVYTVNPDWINRVKEIVGYCLDNNMYVIVNMHHDDQNWLNISVDENEWEKVKEKYRQIWQQVASAFKDYDEHLILEGTNEITATNGFDNGACITEQHQDPDKKCWWGHTQKVFDRHNELHQIFVDTVRSTGGNNKARYLMLPTYAAQWYANQVNKVLVPNDDTHIIIDIHWYNVNDQIRDSTRRSYANTWKKFCDKYNVAIALGECGFSYKTNIDTKISWASSFVKDLKETYDIPVFLWDDGGDMKILDRKSDYPDWATNSVEFINIVTRVVLNLPEPTETTEPTLPPEPIKGDIDGDEECGPKDIFYLQKYLAKVKTDITKMPKQADVNNDNLYDVKDVILMKKFVAHLITSFD